MEAEGPSPCSQDPSTSPLCWAIRISTSKLNFPIQFNNIILSSVPRSSKLPLDFIFPIKMYSFLICPTRATFPAHLILDLIILIIFDEEHNCGTFHLYSLYKFL